MFPDWDPGAQRGDMLRSSTPVGSAVLGTIALGLGRALVIGGAPFLVSAVHAEQAATQRIAFICPAGQILKVEFVTSDPRAAAIIHPPAGPAVSLPLLPSGDGFRYGDAGHELRGKGDWVTWTEGSKPAVTCKAALSDR